MWDLSTLTRLNDQRVRTLRAARKAKATRERLARAKELERLLEKHCSTRSLDSAADRRAVARLLAAHG